ncbi:MAG: hypothetical protein H6Q66_285 [Firmicutes bacterium]|nr:hypothetical protein [Bacillota bacterium]
MTDESKGTMINLGGYSIKTVVICTLFGLCFGMAGGAWMGYAWGSRPVEYRQADGQITQPLPVAVDTIDTTAAAVAPSEQEGDVVQFRQMENKIVALVNGREYAVPNLTGSNSVQLGSTGQLQLVHQTTSQIDVTPIVNQMLADKLALEKSKQKNNAIGTYLTTESCGVVISKDTARQRVMLLAGKKWAKQDGRQVEVGGAWQWKF